MVYSHNGVLINNKRELSTDSGYNRGKLRKHHAKRNKPVTKDYILYNSIFIKCPEKQIYTDRSRLVVSRCWGGEGVTSNERGISYGDDRVF